MITMCNGDLGMYRVMPWAYPTIPGQSSGGTTVDPTPEPSYPYDMSKITASFAGSASNISHQGFSGGKRFCCIWFIQIAGLKEIDTTEVNSLKIIFTENTLATNPNSFSYGGVTYTHDMSMNDTELAIPVSSSTDVRTYTTQCGFTPLLSSFPYTDPDVTVTRTGSLKLKIVAYNSSGDVIQESGEVVVS